MLHVYVQDADAVYWKIIALGCTPVQELTQKDIGGDTNHRGGFKDFTANHWSVVTRM